MIALINQSIGKPVGFINPLLYKHPAFNGVLFDILKGSNGVKNVKLAGTGKMNVKGYKARKGWDACTGLGSPNGFKLLNALKGNIFSKDGIKKKLIFRKYILDKLGFIEYDSRTFSVISLIILAALIVDYFISSSIDAFNPQASSSWGVLLFSTIAIICILGQYLILFITKKRMSKYNVKDSQIITLQKVMMIVLYVMTAVVAVVLLQIYIFSWYYIHLISLVVVIAYGFTSIIMGILAYKLLNWYLSKRSLIILIYGLAAASFTINAVVSAILFEQLLVEKPLIFTTHSVVEFNFECDTNPFKCFITNFQSYTMYAYVLAMWCGSIVLLHYHIKRVGKVKFWVLVTLPLVALYLGYVSAYGELYQMSSTVSKEQTPVIKMSLIIAFTISLGILNGIGFRISRNASKKFSYYNGVYDMRCCTV